MHEYFLFFANKMFQILILLLICFNCLIEKCQAPVGERKRTLINRSDGTIVGDYLVLLQTTYQSNTPAFLTLTTANELECKCICSTNKQCLSIVYRLSDLTCLLYATDPCDIRYWQLNPNANFYVNIKRLRYRLFEKPGQNQPLKRLAMSTLCGNISEFNSERRWLFATKISGQSKVNFDGLNFNNAPNQVAPSPWSTSSLENIWNSILLQQWNSRLYFPKYFGFALLYNGVVREFVYFRLHKTSVENFFNRQHIPVAFCWNLKPDGAHFHPTLDHAGYFKRLFSISINGNTSNTLPCEQHETFMYISPIDRSDRCSPNVDSSDSLRIMFSDQCQPSSYAKLLRADALIGLTSGDTTAATDN